jgi:uncharacterized protein
MKCPICTDTDLMMAERQGVEIDYCPDCRGVWLDRGELDVIVERSRGQSASTPGKQDRYDDRDKGSKKKSSIFGDLLGGLGG